MVDRDRLDRVWRGEHRRLDGQRCSIAYTGTGISDSNATAAKLILADNTITNLGFLIASSGDWNSDAAKAIGLAIVKDSQMLAVSTSTHYEFSGGEGNNPFPGNGLKGFISFDFGDGRPSAPTRRAI